MKTLIVIGGKSGTAEGDKVVGHIVQALISHVFLSDITWTGKAGKGKEKKIALEKYANIVRVIFSLCHNADHSYTLQKCRNAVIYKVLKHAYRAKSVIGATQQASTSTSDQFWKKKKVIQYQDDHQNSNVSYEMQTYANEWRQNEHRQNEHRQAPLNMATDMHHRYEVANANEYGHQKGYQHTQTQALAEDMASYQQYDNLNQRYAVLNQYELAHEHQQGSLHHRTQTPVAANGQTYLNL